MLVLASAHGYRAAVAVRNAPGCQKAGHDAHHLCKKRPPKSQSKGAPSMGPRRAVEAPRLDCQDLAPPQPGLLAEQRLVPPKSHSQHFPPSPTRSRTAKAMVVLLRHKRRRGPETGPLCALKASRNRWKRVTRA